MIFNFLKRAKDIFYNNKNSGFVASNVQDMLDACANSIGLLDDKIDDAHKVESVSTTVNNSNITSFSTLATKYGKLCVVDFNMRIAAGTYSGSDILFTVGVAPKSTTRVIISVGNDAFAVMKISTAGKVTFNSSSVTIASQSYMLGQCVFVVE